DATTARIANRVASALIDGFARVEAAIDAASVRGAIDVVAVGVAQRGLVLAARPGSDAAPVFAAGRTSGAVRVFGARRPAGAGGFVASVEAARFWSLIDARARPVAALSDESLARARRAARLAPPRIGAIDVAAVATPTASRAGLAVARSAGAVRLALDERA